MEYSTDTINWFSLYHILREEDTSVHQLTNEKPRWGLLRIIQYNQTIDKCSLGLDFF